MTTRPCGLRRAGNKCKKTCQFKTWCKGDKSNIKNSTDHFCADTRQNALADRNGITVKSLAVVTAALNRPVWTTHPFLYPVQQHEGLHVLDGCRRLVFELELCVLQFAEQTIHLRARFHRQNVVHNLHCTAIMKKRSERRKHCALAVVRRSQIFSPRRGPFPGAQDGQNVISWRWSLPSPTNPVW